MAAFRRVQAILARSEHDAEGPERVTGAAVGAQPVPTAVAVARLHSCVSEMTAIVQRVMAELPPHDVDQRQRADITKFCSDFEQATRAIQAEIRILEDKLGLHPGEAPYDRSVLSREPIITIYIIRKWLSEEIDSIKAILRRLERGAAYRVVARATVDLIRIWIDAESALMTIRVHVTREE
jgi:hypothetical protein